MKYLGVTGDARARGGGRRGRGGGRRGRRGIRARVVKRKRA